MARNLRRFREIFHVPAERMEYYYMLREDMPQPPAGIIGYIFNDTCENVRIALEVDEEYLDQQKSIYPLLYIDPSDYLSECRIILSRAMASLLLRKDMEIIYAIWHELGHFHTMEQYVEDYMNYADRSQAGYTAEQYLAIVKGEVMEYEKAADQFALDYVGYDLSVAAINGMLGRAKKNCETANNRGLLQDLLNRKKLLKELNSAAGPEKAGE